MPKMSWQSYTESQDPLDEANKRYRNALGEFNKEVRKGAYRAQTSNGRYHEMYFFARMHLTLNPDEAYQWAMNKVQKNMHYHGDDPDYDSKGIDVYSNHVSDYFED